MMKNLEIYQWIKAKINSEVWLTDFHLNDHFLEFCDKFYPKTKTKSCITIFNRHMKQFVLEGKVSKNKKSYRGIINEFGRKQITTYVPISKL